MIKLSLIICKKPKILFLDEATSHLDVAREEAVNAAVRAHGMTRVIVAHRPETIRSADRVITLEQGKLIDAPQEPYRLSYAAGRFVPVNSA